MPDPNRFLQGPFAPVEEEITAFDLPVTGALPAAPERPLPAQRAEPAGPGRSRPTGSVKGTGSWVRAWCTGCGCATAGPSGTATAGSSSRQLAEAMDEKWPGGPVHNGMDFAANTHIIAHAGRYLATVEAGPLPYELSGELGHRRPVRLFRHAARRLRGPHQARPRDGRAARNRLLLGLGPRPARDHRRRRHGQPHHRHPGRRRPDDARLRAHLPATWCCSTCRSPSAWTRCRPG